jgi:holo-[acyl-carrier protein] synthase
VIIGIGIDQIEVDRVQRSLDPDRGFRERVFAPAEIEYCDSHKNAAQHYAARFAAKEAFLKALGSGWRGGLEFSEIEVVSDDLGKPSLRLTGACKAAADRMGVIAAHVSLSHLKTVACAVVMLEGK